MKHYEDFFHLAFAAFSAISLRFFGDSFSALALPPFNPPKRPNATAAGFFPGGALASSLICPVASATI
ncbi:MAG: hypothetical protein ABSC14_02290 [Desulfomonilia bacterium]|jgi:hypothetical protein